MYHGQFNLLKRSTIAYFLTDVAETTILDTSTEDADELPTPRKPGPASRTTRRSSSSRLAATPAKVNNLKVPYF